MTHGRTRPIVCLLASSWILGMAVVTCGQNPGEPIASAVDRDEMADRLSRLSSDTVLAVVARPGPILASPAAGRLPMEVSLEGFRQQTGMDLSQVEWLLAFGERPADGPLSFGMVVRFARDFDWRQTASEHIARHAVWPAGWPALPSRTRPTVDQHLAVGRAYPDPGTRHDRPPHARADGCQPLTVRGGLDGAE